MLGTFLALVAMLAPISALCYPIAIVLPKKDAEARALIRLSVYISLGIAVLITLAIIIVGNRLLELIGAEAITAFKFLIPVNVLFAAWLQISQQWVIRKKQFKVKARAAVTQALLVNGAKTGIGFSHPLAAVLIVLSSVGQILQAALLYFGLKRNNSLPESSNDKNTETPIHEVGRRHRDFPIYRAPQVFINAISLGLPVLMLAAFFGPASAGFYTLGKKLLQMPIQIIGQSVSAVFYPRVSEAANRGEDIAKLIIRATISLAGVGIVPIVVIILFGPFLFGFVFGQEWNVAGEYARWMSFMLFFQFINRPAVAAIPVLGLQRGLLYYELLSTGSKLAALYVGFILFHNDVFAVAIFSLAGTAAYVYLIAWVIYSAHKHTKVTNE